MIDARTRAIYVIGGHDGTAYFSDVWLSTDGGARTELARGMVGVLGVLKVLAGYSGVPRVLWGYSEYSRGSLGVPRGYLRGTRWLPWGTTLGTLGKL